MSRTKSCFAIVFVLCMVAVLSAAPSSKYVSISKGIGNIVVGESLPYGKDAGWRNFYLSGSTIKAGEAFKKWNEFYIRCFLPTPLRDTEWAKNSKNAICYFIVFMLPNGKIFQPAGKAPAILCAYGERGSSSPAYLMRDSHGLSWGTRSKKDWAVGTFIKDVNPADPNTFVLDTLKEVDEGKFEPWNLGKDLKDALNAAGGRLTMKIYAKVFQLKGTKTVDVKEMQWHDINMPWKKRKSMKITIAPVYDNGRLIAEGKWTIVP